LAKSKDSNNVDFSELSRKEKIEKLKRRIRNVSTERCPDQTDLANNTTFIFDTWREIQIFSE